MDKLIKTGYLVLLIWLCLSQLTLNQRQYATKRIQSSRQSKDLKKVSQPNRHRSNNEQHNRFSPRNNPFQDFLGESSEMVLTNDENNDVVSNWNSNGWKPPASGWQPPSNGWQPPSNGWDNGWNNGWWQQDPWKDPYTKLSLGKQIKRIKLSD